MKKEIHSALNKQFKEQFGLVPEAYHKPELVEKIADLIIFPKYVAKTIMPYCLVGVLIPVFFGAWAAYTDRNGLAILLFIVGTLLGVLNGGLFGTAALLKQIPADLKAIFSLALNLTEQAFLDLQKMKTNSDKIQMPKISEVLRFMLFSVVMPSIKDVLIKKVPFLATPLANIFDRFFNVATKNIAAKENEQEKAEPTASSNFMKRFQTIKGHTDKTIPNMFRLVSLPIVVMRNIVAVFTASFALLLWWLM